MIIDNHTHAFLPADLGLLRERLTLLDASLDDGDPHKWQMLGAGDLPSLAELMRRAGHDRYVLLPVTGSRDKVSDLNRWAASAAVQYPELIAFGTLHPKGAITEDLGLMLDLGLKGVKLHPFIQRFALDGPESLAMLALVAEAGLPILVDTLHPEGLRAAKPHTAWALDMLGFAGCRVREIAAAAKALPKLKIIAAHGGSLYGWDRIGPLFELPNVYFDLSYLAGLLPPEEVLALVRTKGPERTIYGTDAPWRDPVAFRAWFEDLGLTSGEREMVAAGTLLELIG